MSKRHLLKGVLALITATMAMTLATPALADTPSYVQGTNNGYAGVANHCIASADQPYIYNSNTLLFYADANCENSDGAVPGYSVQFCVQYSNDHDATWNNITSQCVRSGLFGSGTEANVFNVGQPNIGAGLQEFGGLDYRVWTHIWVYTTAFGTVQADAVSGKTFLK